MEQPKTPVSPTPPPAAGARPKSRGAEHAQRLLAAAAKLVYSSKESANSLVQMVANAPSPEEGLAHAALAVMNRIRESVKGLNPNFVFGIAPLVIAMIAELAAAAKVIQPNPELLTAALEKMKPMIAQIVKGGAQQPAAAQPPAEEPPAQQGMVAQAMEE